MNDPVADFRRLTPDELRRKLKELNSFCMASPTELSLFAQGLFGHLLKLAEDTFSFVEDMEIEIEGLPQHHSGKRLLLREVRRLPFESPIIGRDIAKNLHRALVNKPPEAEKKKVREHVVLAGVPYTFPEGLAPNE